jgi:hypothetical protein
MIIYSGSILWIIFRRFQLMFLNLPARTEGNERNFSQETRVSEQIEAITSLMLPLDHNLVLREN